MDMKCRFYWILGVTLAGLALLWANSPHSIVAKVEAAGFRAPAGAIGERPMAFVIFTASFPNGGPIPRKFTCDGADLSPEVSWTGSPTGTQSFVLIADDPDAPVGTWTHWVLFDVPAQTNSLAEGIAKVDEVPSGGRQGRNDFRRIGYGGPCPPPGKPHRYFFKLYALDKMLSLKPGCSKAEVEQAMQNHVLGKAELMGTYQR